MVASDDINDWATIRRRIIRCVLPALFAVASVVGVYVWLDYSAAHRKELNTDLIYTVQVGTPAEVRDLLARGADPDARDIPGGEPIRFWQWLRQWVTTRGRGRFAQGEPALVCAGRNSKHHAEIIRILVEHGASVNARDDDGRTALSGAARSGDLATVQLLLSRGADANTKDSIGFTPLECAVLSEEPRVVKMLVERGANVNVSLDRYVGMMSNSPTKISTLLGLARTLSPGPHRTEIVRLLNQAGAKQ